MSDNSRGFKSEFWIGQLVVVISTILGVYLAATVGFKKAVDLTLLTSDRNTFYLASSFEGEISSNTDKITSFMAEHAGSPFMPDGVKLTLNQFVFETMKEAESTLELDPLVVNGVSSFYLEAGDIIERLNAKALNKGSGFKRLRTLVDDLQASELPQLQATVEKLREGLVDAGITP